MTRIGSAAADSGGYRGQVRCVGCWAGVCIERLGRLTSDLTSHAAGDEITHVFGHEIACEFTREFASASGLTIGTVLDGNWVMGCRCASKGSAVAIGWFAQFKTY